MKKLNVKIKAEGTSALGWHVVLHEVDDDRLQISTSLGARKNYGFWEGSHVIPFYFRANRTFDLSTEEKETLGYEGFNAKYPFGKIIDKEAGVFKPIMYWSAGLLKEPIKSVSPKEGNYMFVSPEVKTVLEQYHLPLHRFYPVSIEHELTSERQDYFLFYIPEPRRFSIFQDSLVNKIPIYFGPKKRRSNLLKSISKTYPIGTFSDYQTLLKKYIEDLISTLDPEDEDYQEAIDEFSEGEVFGESHQYMMPYYILEESYDMYWYKGDLVATEDLANALNKVANKEYISSDLPPIYTGVNPDDELPEELLNIPAPVG